jgi:uncharacterized protein YndB with AHSA1/START domain
MPRATESAAEAGHVLELKREFAAPRELVFRAWTTAEMAKRWWGCNEFPASHMEMDVRPGGRWRACLRSDEGHEIWLGGEFVEISSPDRLIFTFVREAAPAIGIERVDTRITVVFTERAGRTSIHFRQEFFATVALRDSHETGWSTGMTRLDGILSDSADVLFSTTTSLTSP